ncbi:HD-domain/PDEase-like protein [Ramaria rubella]|nr:HD-domain/PDEase-like protein [Ramaria rubella]
MSSQSSTIDPNVDDIRESFRDIKCPIHGYIPSSKLITSIIDTPQFQRLRNLKQLGTSYYVWPGASHNRFEHSIGVFHLASEMVKRLQRVQPELNITDRDIRCVEVAGLCHDLGHGPFSHVWDNHFIPQAMPGSNWKHEDASEMMLDYLVSDNNIDLRQDEVRFIKDLIAGSKSHTRSHSPSEKDFLFEIVANKRNGIDVDKFDYIDRDTHAVSTGKVTDVSRLVNTARVIDNQICYSEKNTTTVYHLFQERFNLHKSIYNHKTSKSIEFMVVDALIKADKYLRLSERIHDPKRFMYLNDDILLEVERSECPELEESRQIIRRIRTRDLYKIVDKKFLPWESRELWRKRFTPENIVAAAKRLDSPAQDPEVRERIADLKEEHVIVDLAALHHGMGDKFPLDNCKFYGKYTPNKAYPPRREDISHLLPKEFGEVWNRVFTRDSRFYGVVQSAARALHEEISAPTAPSSPVHRIDTTEEPVTPRATSSFSSILSEPVATSRQILKTPGTFMTSVNATPLHNNCMTVPVGFTPKAPRHESSQTMKTRKREEELDEIDELGEPLDTRSPKRKKKKPE